MTSKAWQHPYVNIFKHLKVEEWKKSTREGDVSTYMDKTLKCSVYRIRGSIPASNFILLPKTSTQSLGLTGHYFYLLFRPIPGKHFVVHLDVASEESQVIRISFSNLFKEFKSTATWLQFPYVCEAVQGSLYESTARTARQGLVGPTPSAVHWTCLVLDLQCILSIYMNRSYSHFKSIKLCANMSVKNLFTSDILFDPGLTFTAAKQTGLSSPGGTAPMPRAMCFPVPKGDNWHDLYDYIRFPSDGAKLPFHSIQKGASVHSSTNPNPVQDPCVHFSKPVQRQLSLIEQITSPKVKPRRRCPLVTTRVPDLCTEPTEPVHSVPNESWRDQETNSETDREDRVHVQGDVMDGDDRGVHVYAHRDDSSISQDEDSDVSQVFCASVPCPISLPSKKASRQRTLQPDPILKLNRIMGFGGCTTKCALWTKAGDFVVYPCHAVIISMNIATGAQTHFIGHTDKVSALAFSGNGMVLASAQMGPLSVVRLWDYLNGSCVAMFKSQADFLSSLSFSYSGSVLCGVGRNRHNKTLVVVWNTERASKTGEVTVLAKAHTDVDVKVMKISSFDDSRMVSCGWDNLRLWRLRNGSLRSCPVNLGEYHSLEFTDVAFEEGHFPDREPEDRMLFASSTSGYILEIDYKTVVLTNVRRLLPTQQTHKVRREKQTFRTGPGIAVNSISINPNFCATGSEDGYLRIWPLDFSAVFLEAEHEGPVSLVSFSQDGLRVLATTDTGNLGYLDINCQQYSTLMRSHTDTVLGFSVDGVRRHITTASCDGSVRIWDMDSMQQLYDFVSEETPSSVAFHPSQQVFSCGFRSGTVRVFNISSSSLLAEHKLHRGEVIGLAFSPDGEYMYSAGSQGCLVLYCTASDDHQVRRVLGNVVERSSKHGPDALAVSSDSRILAFVGPSEYIVTLMDARSLDELLRVDVSILDVESTSLDSALKVCFPPALTGHLLVATSANKILWLSAKTGRLLREVPNVHKQPCCSLAVSEDGRFLLTAGHKTLKVWDYDMQLDINAQVFIGHSQPIQQVGFTPDQMGVITVGDAIYYWDFLAYPQTPVKHRSTSVAKSPHRSEGLEGNACSISLSNGKPRLAPPLPSSPPSLNISSINRMGHNAESFLSPFEEADEMELVGLDVASPSGTAPTTVPTQPTPSFLRVTEMAWDTHRQRRKYEVTQDAGPLRPDSYKHFTPHFKTSSLDQKATPPQHGEEGLVLKAVIGYNGNGRGNMVWNADTGLFAYTCGCVVVVEDLHTGSQRHWLGHTEEISSLAASHDSQTLVSASGSSSGSPSIICIWNVHTGTQKNTISYHKGAVQAIAFSRDDFFFFSVGDYRDPGLALWSTKTYTLLTSVSLPGPLHDGAFSPFCANQLACVGSTGALFCLIESHGLDVELKVHNAPLPAEIRSVELTALCYSSSSTLYTSTNSGQVCAWDCCTSRCIMTWEADEGEIGVLLCRGCRLMTGSNTRRIRLWSVPAVHRSHRGTEDSDGSASVLMEQEITLDGTVVSAAFDDSMDIGIVGTTAGTLWYINWLENSSIRLISSHKSKVNGVVFSPEESHFATCGEDGSVRVWLAASNELVVQFQVLNQSCRCICWSPSPRLQDLRLAAGYSDGTLRIFRLATSEMELKLHPHPASVSAIQYSLDGQFVLTGSTEGLVAVSSPLTGMTVRVISDHKGACINTIQYVKKQYRDYGLEGSEMWLATSSDRRVSIWVSDWMKAKCELLDWLTFPAPSAQNGSPPSLGAFCPSDPGVVIYTGYGVEKELTFYSLAKKQVIRKIALSHWATCLGLSPIDGLIAVGCNERLLKLIRGSSGKFQDFPIHSDSLQMCHFSPSGRLLFTTAYNEIFLWEVRGFV